MFDHNTTEIKLMKQESSLRLTNKNKQLFYTCDRL